jgi:hypothetical protein
MIRRSIIILTTSMLASGAFAQSECKDHHKFECPPSTDTRFSVNGQSRSASVQVGVPTELNIILYKGQDYRISVCPDVKILGDQVVIRLIERVRTPSEKEETINEKHDVRDEQGELTGETKDVKRTEKHVVYDETVKVLWDNQEHDMAQEVEFTAGSTKRIAIEVVAAGAASPAKPKRSDVPFDIGCLGILIEHMPTPNVGF